MNFGSKVAVVLLLLAVVLCPFAACAMSAGQTGAASHPCCPSGKSHQSPVQQSDCKCIAAQPPAPTVILDGGSMPLAAPPVAVAAAGNVTDSGRPLVSIPIALSDQNTFIAVHQFRI